MQTKTTTTSGAPVPGEILVYLLCLLSFPSQEANPPLPLSVL